MYFFLFILINNEEMLNVNVTEEEDLKQLETDDLCNQ